MTVAACFVDSQRLRYEVVREREVPKETRFWIKRRSTQSTAFDAGAFPFGGLVAFAPRAMDFAHRCENNLHKIIEACRTFCL